MLINNPPVQISDGIFMLGVNEYPVYLLKDGNEAILLEGGVGAVGPVVAEQLAEMDLALEDVKQIVITHAHPDHVMAVPEFRAMFKNASVCASQAAAGTLSFDKAIGFFRKIDGMLTEALIKAGSIDQRHRPKPFEGDSIAVDRVLSEGDTVTARSLRLNCLATPGHSDCSLSFYEPNRQLVFISDATGYYIPQTEYFWPNYFSDYGAYVESIERLISLDAKILCLGHNAAIKGADAVKAYLEKALDSAGQWHERIVQMTQQQCKSSDMIGTELGAEVYEQTQLLNIEFFQKNCEQLAKQSAKFADES